MEWFRVQSRFAYFSVAIILGVMTRQAAMSSQNVGVYAVCGGLPVMLIYNGYQYDALRGSVSEKLRQRKSQSYANVLLSCF
jgi:hypothetical protein